MNDLLLNIFSNYIPNKTVLCDDKDPPWVINGVRTAIKMKNKPYNEYIRSGRRHDYYARFENVTIELSSLTRDTKTEFHSKLAAQMVNPSTSVTTYWSIWKTFANNRKICIILPLLINGDFISNFKTKANYFNRIFYEQCTTIATGRSEPSSVSLATNETVTTINFDE